MKTIPLTQGKIALVDDADYELVMRFKWSAHCIKGKFYAVTNSGRLHMHRLISGVPGRNVDHKNGDGLNNQRFNLRPSTTSQNGMNRGKQRNNTSGFKGVTRSGKKTQPWMAQIKLNRKLIHLGCHKTAEAAARAYDVRASVLFGAFAVLNFPKNGAVAA